MAKTGGDYLRIAVLHLSKIGVIPIELHREIPDDGRLKQVTVKQEPPGEWFATFGVETDADAPPKPDEPERCVGIDMAILKFVHDTDGHAVGSLGLSAEEGRLKHEQRVLSRKEHGSNNYREQQRKVARRHADIERKCRDFLPSFRHDTRNPTTSWRSKTLTRRG